MSGERIRVRVLYAAGGGYHSEIISVPGGGLSEYERLIDFLREDAAVAAECYIDAERLCSARIAGDDDTETG